LNKRIESIDLLRGVVMVIMALDHSRVFLNYGMFFSEPTNMATTTPLLFFTRWITHFCAPVFVFLAGTSTFLYGTKKESKKDVSFFLFTRGLWLIVLEVTVMNFGWFFDIGFALTVFQVIYAIGFSMICLSGLIWLPKKILLTIGFLLVAGHNLFDSVTFTGTGILDILWYVFHQQHYVASSADAGFYFYYPVIPWIGLMILGFLFGEFYKKEYDPEKRQKALLWIGISATFLFIVIRSINIYGDMIQWNWQKNTVFTIMSFLNTTKYPPSFQFLLMTIGPSILFLYFTENVKNKISDALVVFGRVPMFFYIIHIYIFHALALIGAAYNGKDWSNLSVTANNFFSGVLADYGFSLFVVYFAWIAVVIFLFPFSKKYNNYKSKNRDKVWLSYL